jgi:death-on-curing protein
LLEPALGQTRQTFEHTNDIFRAAAQYCFSLAKNHPFVNGNKCTAADCMLTFLVLNGVEPTLTLEQLFGWTLRVAIGDLDRQRLARLLQDPSRQKRR